MAKSVQLTALTLETNTLRCSLFTILELSLLLSVFITYWLVFLFVFLKMLSLELKSKLYVNSVFTRGITLAHANASLFKYA